MPEYTNNYNLIKPKKSENYDIDDVTRTNADILDTILYQKVGKVVGKGLSTNDFTTEYKKKIDALQILYKIKGKIETLQELNLKIDKSLGDVWNCEEDGNAYRWDGNSWVNIGKYKDFDEILERIDKLSKTYKGTNITAPTIKGFGKVNKIYGKTELSSNNLTCVADKHINLFNINDIVNGSIDASTGASSSSGGLYITQNYINVKSSTAYANSNVEGLLRIFEYNNSKGLIKTFTTNDGTFTTSATTKYMKIQKGTPFGKKYKLEEGSKATSYSKFEEGVIEVISESGENISTKAISCKPLCCLKDAENNVIAQDYIDFIENKIHRECGYIASYNNENITTNYISSTGSLSAGATVVYKLQNTVEEDFNCSDGIVQYDNQTTIYNADDAEMEVTLTQNQMISNINKNINDIQQRLNNRKTLELNFGALPNNSAKSMEHGLNNVNIKDYYAIAVNQNGTTLKIPHASTNNVGTIEMSINSTDVTITTNSDRSKYNATVYIEYEEN